MEWNIKYELINGNGKVKEYNKYGKLRFEGEYLNGKRNGKGKEYNDGELVFEGEYLNGYRWNGKYFTKNDKMNFEIKDGCGMGKDYNNSKLIYEGEFLDGRRNGKGKEYNHNGELKFEGEYNNSKKWNGKGKEYYYNGKLAYEGEYLNGQRNGKGKEYNNDGKLDFEGEYLNGKKWNGKNYNNHGLVDFQIKDGYGIGKEYNNDELNNLFPFYLFFNLNTFLQIYSNCKLEYEGDYLNGKLKNIIIMEH